MSTFPASSVRRKSVGRFALPTLALCLVSLSAQAGVITIGGAQVAAPSHTEDFNGGAVGWVTNQFVANAMTFTPLSGGGIALVDNAICGDNSPFGVSGKYLYMGVSAPCNGETTSVQGVSIKFDADVAELSWTGFASAYSEGFRIEALLANAVVSSTVFILSNQFMNQTVLVSGSVFDELRFTELNPGGNSGSFALDNFRWTNANAQAVPEPGSLGLLALGLAGLGLSRRQHGPL